MNKSAGIISILAVVSVFSVMAQAPVTPPVPIRGTLIYNITPTTIIDCGGAVYACIDNRSAALRQNDFHSYRASGSGTWSIDMQYADITPTSWSSYGSTGQVSNTGPSSGVGYGIDPISLSPSGKRYHDFIRFVITGTATIENYTGLKDIWSLPSAGAISYPLTSNQGGTGSSTLFNNTISAGDAASWSAAVTAVPSGGTLILDPTYNVTDSFGATLSNPYVTIDCRSGSSVTAGYDGPTLTIASTATGTRIIGDCRFHGGEAANPTWTKPVIAINGAPYVFIDRTWIDDQANSGGSGNYGLYACNAHGLELRSVNFQASGTVLGSDGTLTVSAKSSCAGTDSDGVKIDGFFENPGCSSPGECGDVIRIDRDATTSNSGGSISPQTTVMDGAGRFPLEMFQFGREVMNPPPLSGWSIAGHYHSIVQPDGALISLTEVSNSTIGLVTLDHHGFYNTIGTVEHAGWNNNTLSGATELNCPVPQSGTENVSLVVDSSGGHNTISGFNGSCGAYDQNIQNFSNETGEVDDDIGSNLFTAYSNGVGNGVAAEITNSSCCTSSGTNLHNNHFVCKTGGTSAIALFSSSGIITSTNIHDNHADGCTYAYIIPSSTGVAGTITKNNLWNASTGQFSLPNNAASMFVEINDPGYLRIFKDKLNAPAFVPAGAPQPTACTTGTGLDAGGTNCLSDLLGPGQITGNETVFDGTLLFTTSSPSSGTHILFTLTMPAGAFTEAPICSAFPVYATISSDPLNTVYSDLSINSATSVSFTISTALASGREIQLAWHCSPN